MSLVNEKIGLIKQEIELQNNKNPLISLIMVACDGTAEYTIKAIKSIKKYTNISHELTVVDNATNDGTTAYLKSQKINYIRISGKEPISYGAALNKGLKAANGRFLCILNNDIFVTPNWIQLMLNTFKEGLKLRGVNKIGIVGPMSNAVGYDQKVADEYLIQFGYSDREQDIVRFANAWGRTIIEAQEFPYNCERTGLLVGFCWLMSRECYEAVGDFADFDKGGFEDNDYVYRAATLGYASLISKACFVHHEAHVSFNALGYKEKRFGMSNRRLFYDAHDTSNNPKKLVIGVAANKITDKLYKDLLKLVNNDSENIIIAKDKKELLLSMGYSNADWLLYLGEKDRLEPRVTREMLDKLMNPKNPMTYAYESRVITLWNDERFQRMDNIFGARHTARLFRNIKGFGIEDGVEPLFPSYNMKPCPYRIYDYSLLTKQDRLNEYKCLTTQEQIDFEVILDEMVQVTPVDDELTLGLITCIKDEMAFPDCHLETFLDLYHTLFDEMIIVDTGSTDNSIEVAKYYGAKVFQIEWNEDFSEARNFGIERCSTKFIMHADPDERFGSDVLRIRKWIEPPIIACRVPIVHPEPGLSLKDCVITQKCRIFRNLPNIRYKDPVHEEVESSINSIGQSRKVFPIDWMKGMPFPGFYHYGNQKDPAWVKNKKDGYENICRKMLEKEPNHKYANWSLAISYAAIGKMEKAFEHLEKSMIGDPNFGKSYQAAARLKIKEGEDYLKRGLMAMTPNTRQYEETQRMIAEISKFSLEIRDR